MARLSPGALVYTSAFGARDPIKTSAGITPSYHWGSDFGPIVRNDPNVVLQAVIAGRVNYLSDVNGALGIRVGDRATLAVELWHLSKRTVTNGSTVAEGAAIGVMGSTGLSTGVHVHVEVWVNGKRIDPKPFIDRQASKAVAPAPADYYEEELTMADVQVLKEHIEWIGKQQGQATRAHITTEADRIIKAISDEGGRIKLHVEHVAKTVKHKI